MFIIGNIKHDTIITRIKLNKNCVSFARHSRIFLVVGSSISTARTTINGSTSDRSESLDTARPLKAISSNHYEQLIRNATTLKN